MNILVTGANGQLGNGMRIVSSASGDRYIFTDVCSASDESVAMLRKLAGDKVCTDTAFLDITDIDAIRKMVLDNDVKAIVNCAAYTNVEAAETNFELAEKLNADAPENLAVVMKEVGGLLVQIYNVVDMFIVGRTLGAFPLAAVGSTGSILFLIVGFLFGMTAGFSIVTAQRFGAKDQVGVRKSFCANIINSFVVGLVITLIGFFWSDDILVKMNTPPEIMEDARVYLTILLAGVYSTVIYNLLSSTIMALGDSKTPLIFLIIACFLNGAMDYIFIVTFKMGIAGAAWATVIAQFLSGLLCLIYIMHRAKILILRWEDWRGLTCLDLWRSIRLGLPMGFQTCIIALGCIVVQIALNKLGPVAVAAFTTANKVDFFAMAPMMSFGMAMATYVGQNYGAGKFDRIKDGVHRCCRMSLTFTVFISLINIYYGSYFVSLFVGKEEVEVIQLSHVYMALNASMYWVLAFLFIYRYTLQGLGQSVVPTFAGVMELVMRLAAVEFLVVPLGFGGVCLASPLAWIGSAVPLAIAYYWTLHRLFARIKRALP